MLVQVWNSWLQALYLSSEGWRQVVFLQSEVLWQYHQESTMGGGEGVKLEQVQIGHEEPLEKSSLVVDSCRFQILQFQ